MSKPVHKMLCRPAVKCQVTHGHVITSLAVWAALMLPVENEQEATIIHAHPESQKTSCCPPFPLLSLHLFLSISYTNFITIFPYFLITKWSTDSDDKIYNYLIRRGILKKNPIARMQISALTFAHCILIINERKKKGASERQLWREFSRSCNYISLRTGLRCQRGESWAQTVFWLCAQGAERRSRSVNCWPLASNLD